MKKISRQFVAILLSAAMIVTFIPLMGGSAAYAESKTIEIDNGEYKVSELIEDMSLAHGDTLEVGEDTTLDVDVSIDLDTIGPKSTGANSLTIKGTGTLGVEHGINLGLYGAFTMESGRLNITGSRAAGSGIYAGIAARNVNINGGDVQININDPSAANLVGIQTPAFKMTDGTATIITNGSGTGYVCGIYCQYATGDLEISGGKLNVSAENDFGYAMGIYAKTADATSPTYVVTVKGGETSIEANRTGGDNYACAAGVFAGDQDAGAVSGLDFYMHGGTLDVDVTNAEHDAYGIKGRYFNITGGQLDIFAGSSIAGGNGYGILTDNNATFLMSGGTVTTKGSTYTTSEGIARGLEYRNSVPTRRIDISGGTLTAEGETNGIYVYNSSSDENGQNQIYGNAKVTVSSETGAAISGVRDGGWSISGEAELTATGTWYNGLFTNGVLLITDTPTVTLTGYSFGGVNRCAVYAENGITIGDTLEILTESGPGQISTSGKTIERTETGNYAIKSIIQPKDVTKANVYCYNAFTDSRITDGSVCVYKNDGPWVDAGSDPISFNVGKGENFTLTAGTRTDGYTFTGWYSGALGTQGGHLISRNETITQNITTPTWYYAEYSPPKTEINTLTFTSDIVPRPGMTRADLPAVTVEEEGVSITGRAWIDMSGHHIPEDHVFALGDQLQLYIDYKVDKTYQLAEDIEDNTTLNGVKPTTHNISDTGIYQTYTISNDLADAQITGLADKVYTGKSLTQDPVVTLNGIELIQGTDYTLSYGNNKKVGTATVTFTGTGEYIGTAAETFRIVPKGSYIKKLSAKKKALYVKWAKRSTKMTKARVTGYVIELATDPEFTTDVKDVKVKGYKKTSKTVKSLKAKTKYYVRVKTYMNVSGTTYESNWSNAKSKTTK
ncbi:MAG: fibronectin type III domain-containing protein [Bacillota bacterium]|nr:fibronectin type III domain-containing protein [Bacillota bacterium]